MLSIATLVVGGGALVFAVVTPRSQARAAWMLSIVVSSGMLAASIAELVGGGMRPLLVAFGLSSVLVLGTFCAQLARSAPRQLLALTALVFADLVAMAAIILLLHSSGSRMSNHHAGASMNALLWALSVGYVIVIVVVRHRMHRELGRHAAQASARSSAHDPGRGVSAFGCSFCMYASMLTMGIAS